MGTEGAATMSKLYKAGDLELTQSHSVRYSYPKRERRTCSMSGCKKPRVAERAYCASHLKQVTGRLR